jgi:hypothetical protein
LLTQQSKSVLCGTVISPAESSSFGLRYSDLDAAPRVRAPAPRDVEHPQEASSSYGSFIYLSSGSSATACSGLQLRWSQGTVRARCWSSEHNPASGAPIDASRFSGRLCYRLGRAKLVVHRADVEPDFAVFERSGSSVPLEAVLDSGDSSDLRGIAARDPSGRLAVVMFGHILDKVQAAGIARSTGPITLPLGSPPAALTENVAASLGSNDV